jgi:hypothetical protein
MKMVKNGMIALAMVASVVAVGKVEAATANPGHQGLSFATKSETCAPCHQKAYNEWRFAAGSDVETAAIGSAHAIANTDPNYVNIIVRVGDGIRPYCMGCHEGKDALGVVDKWDNIPAISPLNKTEGTNCLTCHLDGQTGNIVNTAQFQDNMMLCATCHNESTGMTDLVNEWQTDFIGGGQTKTCLECHMPDVSHVFGGLHSPSMRAKALTLSAPMCPDTVSAGAAFDIQYTVANTGVGHSMPEDLFRYLRARIAVVDAAGVEIFSNEVAYYKKKTMLGEVQADTDVIKALETKHVTVPSVVIATPGTYTVKFEVLQDSNRVFVDRSETFPMGATYKTIVVK